MLAFTNAPKSVDFVAICCVSSERLMETFHHSICNLSSWLLAAASAVSAVVAGLVYLVFV